MPSLSFAEYRSAFPEVPADSLFNRYIAYGGLPYTVKLDDPQDLADYLGGAFPSRGGHRVGSTYRPPPSMTVNGDRLRKP